MSLFFFLKEPPALLRSCNDSISFYSSCEKASEVTEWVPNAGLQTGCSKTAQRDFKNRDSWAPLLKLLIIGVGGAQEFLFLTSFMVACGGHPDHREVRGWPNGSKASGQLETHLCLPAVHSRLAGPWFGSCAVVGAVPVRWGA